jgi:ADP-ribose pyrophosphatase YjhB (NUDIX family)
MGEVAAAYEQLVERFVKWAEAEDNLRAAVVIGSRARELVRRLFSERGMCTDRRTVKITRRERAGRSGRLAVGCSAAVLDPATQRILLVRRADSGRWAVPGGYMEPGESVTEACAREVLEETGVRVRVGRLVAVYTSPHVLLEYAGGNRFQLVVLHFAAEPIGGALSTSDETSEVGYFSRAEIGRMDVGDFNRQRIDDAYAAQATAFVRDDFNI